MSWNHAMAFLAENSLLARLTVASLELLLLTVLLAGVSRWRRLSPRMTSFLWLIVLAKPVISLAIGTPFPLAHFEQPTAASETIVLVTEGDSPAQRPSEGMGSGESLAPSPFADRADGLGISGFGTAEFLLATWMCGVAIFATRHLVVRRRLVRIVSSAKPVPASMQQRHEEIAHELGLARPPRLCATDALDSPALAGTFRPVLLLPQWMIERGMDSNVEWALRHELSHYKWLDPLAIFIRDASSALFHFHPAVWWAGRRHLEAIELACDQSCLRDSSEAPAYAESLYTILKELRERRMGAVRSAGLAMATPGRTTRRITALLERTPVRPLTRSAAAGVALVALTLFAFGLGVERAGVQPTVPSVASKPAPPWIRPPSLFLFGPLNGETFEQIGKVAAGKHNIWGRSHEEKNYADLFENKANPFDRQKKDQLVLLLTLDPAEQLPKSYEDILPVPWSKLQARLEHGDTFEESGSARDLEVLALGAPNRTKLDDFVHSSKRFAALLGAPLPAAQAVTKPSLFFLGPLPSAKFKQLCKAAKGKDDIWGRGHDAKVYEDLFENSSNPFHWKKGDQLVVLLTLEKGDQIPKKYEDILPKTWTELKARLEAGSTVEESGTAHDMQVLVLGAPTRSQLEAMLGESKPLTALLGSSPANESSNDPNRPDVFVMGVGSLFRKVVDNTSKGTRSKTGRAHDEAVYDEIFSTTPNHYDRSDGDLMVLLFTRDGGEKLPAKYQDLLPKPWETIEAAMKKGETVELEGQSRGLKIVVLAAPNEAALSSLVEKTQVLAPFRP